jgi:hypothetical protein
MIFSVLTDWYSNSWMSWWFWRRVSLVLLSSCYRLIERRDCFIWVHLSLFSFFSVSRA